jgi:hypothetical protein
MPSLTIRPMRSVANRHGGSEACIGDADRGYVITVWGRRLGQRFAASFEGRTLEVADGVTTARGVFHDQAQLYGVLERVADMGLELVRVEEDVSTADSSITAKKGQSNVHHLHT